MTKQAPGSTTLAVIGAGSMGAQIAQQAALHGGHVSTGTPSDGPGTRIILVLPATTESPIRRDTT